MDTLVDMSIFSTPEDFIRHEILTKGNRLGLTKKMMYNIIKTENLPLKVNVKRLESISKTELLNVMLTKYTYRDLSRLVGVPMYSFMEKFKITEEQFITLVDEGLFHRTISTTITYPIKYGKNKYTYNYGYNVYDYFYVQQDIVNFSLNVIKKREAKIRKSASKKRGLI